MAADTNISMAGAKAAVNGFVGEMEAGAGNVTVKIFGTGIGKPANPDAGTPTDTLASFNCGTNPFAAAATGTGTETNSAVAEMTADKTDTSADASGTASWFRGYDRDGTAHIDGTVATSSADMIIDNTSINAGQTVKITNWKIKQSRGS